jgi:ribonuclease D
MLVTTEDQLQKLCAAIRDQGRFGLDTEFVQERTYYPRLGIVQVAVDGIEAVLDPGAIGTLDPLFDVVADPKIEKIVHAGRNDFEIFYQRSGRIPANVFDLQVAAAFAGYGHQVSYANLVRRVTGVQLSKLETLTDWTRRPLTPEQIEYALQDVRHLQPVHRHLHDTLHSLGRTGWAREEFRYLMEEGTYQSLSPREIYARLKTPGMNAKTLSVLRELAAWREEEAIRRDIPRGHVMKDEVLVEMARRPPTSRAAFSNYRFLNPRVIERDGAKILEAVKRGLEGPYPQVLKSPPREEPQPKVAPLCRLLESWLRTRAMEGKVAPEMLATRSELEELCRESLVGREAKLPILEGWRRELVGEELLGILKGEIALKVNPKTGDIEAIKQ